ncbi:MAG: hypothetical protein M0014_10965 [Actinomycetota bacterium]|nr:hypothetical protein [Actinomycetota bacterium]
MSSATAIVDEILVLHSGGDQRGGCRVVEGARQAVGDAVEACDGVIDEQRVLPPAEREMVAQVGGEEDARAQPAA